MNKAYIQYYDENNTGNDICGGGVYLLIFNDKIIASHYCSNRDFANHDLTIWRLEELEKHNIDEVISLGDVVWKKDDKETNNKTQAKFEVANDVYEAKYCN